MAFLQGPTKEEMKLENLEKLTMDERKEKVQKYLDLIKNVFEMFNPLDMTFDSYSLHDWPCLVKELKADYENELTKKQWEDYERKIWPNAERCKETGGPTYAGTGVKW